MGSLLITSSYSCFTVQSETLPIKETHYQFVILALISIFCKCDCKIKVIEKNKREDTVPRENYVIFCEFSLIRGDGVWTISVHSKFH